MKIHWLFPTPVLCIDLQPDSAISKAMKSIIAEFDVEVFQDPRFSDRNNITGDLLGPAGFDQIHRSDSFQWLNKQIAQLSSSYLEMLLGDSHGLEIHIQKAWPVICSGNNGTIDLHTHRNAQLSAVYYVQVDENNPTGELEFQAPETFFSHTMAIPFQDAAVSGGVFSPHQDRLIMFPSDLKHRVLPYESELPRYSVSYDLSITTAPGKGKEMRMSHPMDWVPLNT